MRYSFSREFMTVEEPDASFHDAWESLCEVLLRKEFPSEEIVRLRAPDLGVDILRRSQEKAYQCKSSVHGATGRLRIRQSTMSLERAFKHQTSLDWHRYIFATNTSYTGTALQKILGKADELGIPRENVVFRGPDYWEKLCVAHSAAVAGRFFYKVSASEKRLLDEAKEIAHPDSMTLLAIAEKYYAESGAARWLLVDSSLSELKLLVPLVLPNEVSLIS